MAFNMYFMKIAIEHIRKTQNPKPIELYNLFYKNIQETQLRNKLYLDIFTNQIEQEVRKINVVTNDLNEQNIIAEKTQLLMKLDNDTREKFHRKHADYLDALRKVFLFEGPDVL
jgi:hypothetical protein